MSIYTGEGCLQIDCTGMQQHIFETIKDSIPSLTRYKANSLDCLEDHICFSPSGNIGMTYQLNFTQDLDTIIAHLTVCNRKIHVMTGKVDAADADETLPGNVCQLLKDLTIRNREYFFL